ncbi:SDR family oxidoreductase [Actinomadura sp. KC216]|uniref:SDR family NAD(P)-dependent oxidoreductase n=1 Tax=Actinomadura sp. KC216 TaxID=2530370 RepID=UPI0010524FF4|nr:SDR family oxidoreductase [Actinomadura sp. KC216]TDB85920.1 SDR family oxidoreductase [Actinomadura sp. KC216]
MSARAAGERTGRAVVTGAASGIGAAVARRLAADGMDVLGIDRRPCPGIDHRVADLGDLDRVTALPEELDDERPTDVFVSCAGMFEGQASADLDFATYERTLRVNLHAPVYLMGRLAARMAGRGYGRIVAITSIHVRMSEPTALAYDVGKGGLDAAVRTVAIENADRNVLVNAVAPGFVRTGMSIVNGEDELESAWFKDHYLATGRLPMRRAAEPDEVATAVSHLVSGENTYVTGASLTVDGGLSARF